MSEVKEVILNESEVIKLLLANPVTFKCCGTAKMWEDKTDTEIYLCYQHDNEVNHMDIMLRVYVVEGWEETHDTEDIVNEFSLVHNVSINHNDDVNEYVIERLEFTRE